MSNETSIRKKLVVIGSLLLATVALAGAVASQGSVSAATRHQGPYSTTYCLDYYGCTQGWQWTQGLNYGANENHWSTVTRGNGEQNPSRQMRNRNHVSRRQVVIRQNVNGVLRCTVLRYDDRGWVNTPAGRNRATTMKGAGNTAGCAQNTFI